jgi:hypothetical protein
MNDLIYRLRKRAEIRRQIDTRKSVQEGKPDRIADLLEEAADYIDKRKWSGLTDDEFEQAVDGLEDLEDCWVQIEAKLKEKNCG